MIENKPLAKIDLADAVVLGMGATVGAGAFLGLAAASDAAGPVALAAIPAAACVALKAALLTSAHPRIAEHPYARWAAMAAQALAAAAMASVLAGHVASAASPLVLRLMAAGVAVALTALAVAGVRLNRPAAGALLAVALGSLAFFVGTALPGLQRSGFPPTPPHTLVGFARATGLMVLAFGGFQHLTAMADDLEAPSTQRNATLLSILPLAAVYALVAVAALGCGGIVFTLRGLPGQSGTLAPLAVVASFAGHPAAMVAVRVGAVAGCGGALFALLSDWSRPAWQPAAMMGGAAAVLAAVLPAPVLLSLAASGLLAWFALLEAAAAREGARPVWHVATSVICIIMAFVIWVR